MKRLFFYSLLLFAVLAMGSCRRSIEKTAQKIRFEGIERVQLQGLTSAEVVARIDNGSAHRLQLASARIDIHYADAVVGRLILEEPVEIDRRTQASIRTLWRLQISDPLTLFVLYRKVKAGELDRIALSFEIEGRGGPAPLRFSREKMSLSEFLTTFGLSVQDVQNYLKL